MADPTILLALATRAETGGDAALSDDCWSALGWAEYRGRSPDTRVEKTLGWYRPEKEFSVGLAREFRRIERGPRPDLTRSIDAQAELPGRIKEVETKLDGMISAGAVFGKVLCYGEARGENSEQRARLAAKLRAMAAQKESGGER